jgi:acyl carrier protein
MSLIEFINVIEPEFDDIEKGSIRPDTDFRSIEGWNSMMALIVISKINKSFKVTITSNELAQSKSISDLYNLTQHKLQAAI